MNPVIVTFLGARGPYPGSDDLPSVLVTQSKLTILLDAGEGVQHRLHLGGKSVSSVRYVLVSHLHGDHVLGLIPLLQSRSLAGASNSITIIGPEGINDYLTRNFEMLSFKPAYDLIVNEVVDGSIPFRDFSVSYTPLQHSLQTLGFKLMFKGISLCYITDTRPTPSVIDLCRGVDVLIHDSAFLSKDSDLALEYGHSTSVEASELAKEVNPGMLVLYHISSRYKDFSPLVREARKIFPRTYAAVKYMKLYLTPKTVFKGQVQASPIRVSQQKS